MDEQFWHQFEHELFFDRNIVFNMVMQNLETLENFRMVMDLLEDSVFNLVVLDDTQYTDFLYSLNKNFFL